MTLPAGAGPAFEFPLLRRELRAILRTQRAFWLLVTAVGLSGVIPLATWPSGRMAAWASWENLATVNAFFLTQLTAALLIVPAFTAGAISGERERDTYDHLYSTLLSPFSIVFSKALSSSAYVLILLLAAAPSVCVLYLLGGMEFATILKGYAITFAAVVMSGLVCLAQSMRSRRTAHAAVRSFILVIFWNGGLVLLLYLALGVAHVLWGREGTGGLRDIMGWLAFGLCPFAAIVLEVLKGELPPGMAPGSGWWFGPWSVYACGAGLVALGHLAYLLARVRVPEVARSRRSERRLARKAARGPRRRRRALLARVLLALGERAAPLLSNPVFLKEVRSEFFSRVGYRRALFWFPLLIFAGIAFSTQFHPESTAAIWTVALILAIILVAGVAAASFPREVEQGNLDFLRGTLLSMREVLSGKFLASLYSCSGIAAAATWAIGGMLIIGEVWSPGEWGRDPSRAREHLLAVCVAGPVVFAFAYLFTAALATLFSAVARRSVGAMVITYLTLAVLHVGWPLLVFVVVAMNPFREEGLRILVFATNPFAAFFFAVGETLTDNETGVTLALFTAVYGVGSFLLFRLAGSQLEARRARDP